ncbi:hypothetical protein EON65_36435 [archaeon]|nr:MAG: hypothetical protein EON65_36435 [archaeon]
MCHAPKCSLLVLDDYVRNAAISYLARYGHNHVNVYSIPSIIDTPKGFLGESKVEGTLNNNTRLLVLPGTIRYNRRDYTGLFTCVDEISKSANDSTQKSLNFKVVVTGRSYLKAADGRVYIPEHLRQLIEIQADLPLQSYLTLLAQANFVLLFANNNQLGYNTNRISSTVPTALGVTTPLVLPQATLSLYACLKSSSMHNRVAGKTNCDSMKNALSLSHADAERMRQETALCRQSLLDDAYMKLRNLLRLAEPSLEEPQHKSIVDQCSLLPI